MLWAALGSKGPFVVILFPAVEAVAMNLSEIKHQEVEMLGLSKESPGVVLNLLKDRSGDRFLWIHNLTD